MTPAWPEDSVAWGPCCPWSGWKCLAWSTSCCRAEHSHCSTAAEPAWAKLTNLPFQLSQSISCQQNWIWEGHVWVWGEEGSYSNFRVVLCMFQECSAQPAWLKLAEDFCAQARQLCDDVDSPRSRNRLVYFDCASALNMQQFFFHVCLIHPAWLGRSIKRQKSLMLFRDYQKLHIKGKENKPVSAAENPWNWGGVSSVDLVRWEFWKWNF